MELVLLCLACVNVMFEFFFDNPSFVLINQSNSQSIVLKIDSMWRY